MQLYRGERAHRRRRHCRAGGSALRRPAPPGRAPGLLPGSACRRHEKLTNTLWICRTCRVFRHVGHFFCGHRSGGQARGALLACFSLAGDSGPLPTGAGIRQAGHTALLSSPATARASPSGAWQQESKHWPARHRRFCRAAPRLLPPAGQPTCARTASSRHSWQYTCPQGPLAMGRPWLPPMGCTARGQGTRRGGRSHGSAHSTRD